MNKYKVLKEKQQEEVNNFPMFFAFNKEQFKEGMIKLGLEENETNQLYKLGSSGGYYKKSDSEKFVAMFAKHKAERKKAIEEDTTGDGYIYDMFDYELANHEYCYTFDIMPTLDALCLTWEEVKNNPNLLNGFIKARINQSEED